MLGYLASQVVWIFNAYYKVSGYIPMLGYLASQVVWIFNAYYKVSGYSYAGISGFTSSLDI